MTGGEAVDECHCGEKVTFGFDGDRSHHRGMCADCDAARCDAYPPDCPRRGVSVSGDDLDCGHPNHGGRAHACAPFVSGDDLNLDAMADRHGKYTPALVAEVRRLRAALNFKQGIIDDLAATVARLESEA